MEFITINKIVHYDFESSSPPENQKIKYQIVYNLKMLHNNNVYIKTGFQIFFEGYPSIKLSILYTNISLAVFPIKKTICNITYIHKSK